MPESTFLDHTVMALQSVLFDAEHGRKDFAPNAYVINADVIQYIREVLSKHGVKPYERS